jgi:hypothetical protein
MKKILAIAVATAIAAPAMADMTISGTYAYGWSNVDYETPTSTLSYATPTAANTVKTASSSNDTGSGFGVDTAAITVKASETLENGMNVAASMTFDGITDGDGVKGAASSLTLSGDFGTISMSNVEAGSPTRAMASVGAPVNNMEGEVLGAAVGGTSILGYTAPAMGDVTISASLVEAGQAAGEMGAGDDTSSSTVGAKYSANGLMVSADYTVWQDNSTYDDRTRLAATYGMGAIAVGYGYQKVNDTDGSDKVETTAGVSYQVSEATKVGAVYVTAEDSASDKLSGYSVGFSTAIAGNVTLSGNYSDWETSAAADATKTNVVLAYSF